MTPEIAIDILRHAVYVMTIMVCALVLPGLVVGLLVAMFQAATQINEVAMSFVPKLLVTFLSLLLTGPWLLQVIMDFCKHLYMDIPTLIG